MPSASADALTFDAAMLACHCASCASLTLYFADILEASASLTFEAMLLLVKSLLEARLNALSVDLVFHHVLMVTAAIATRYFYPSHTNVTLFVQIIHLALAVNYSRRMLGHTRDGALDRCFSSLWLLVIVARNAMGGAQLARDILVADPVRFVLGPLLLGMAALDVKWTRETLERRPWPFPGAWLLLPVVGVCLGVFVESRPARGIWALSSAASLTLGLETLATAKAYVVRRRPRGIRQQEKVTTD